MPRTGRTGVMELIVDLYLLPTTLEKPNQKSVYKEAWVTHFLKVTSRNMEKSNEKQENGSWVSNGKQAHTHKYKRRFS